MSQAALETPSKISLSAYESFGQVSDSRAVLRRESASHPRAPATPPIPVSPRQEAGQLLFDARRSRRRRDIPAAVNFLSRMFSRRTDIADNASPPTAFPCAFPTSQIELPKIA